MTLLTQTALGAAILATGIIKIVSHVGAGAILTVQMCSGRSVAFPVGNDAGLFERTHCWGCYAALVGASLIALALYRFWQTQRAMSVD